MPLHMLYASRALFEFNFWRPKPIWRGSYSPRSVERTYVVSLRQIRTLIWAQPISCQSERLWA